jgi:hypothetical protein
MVRQKEFKASNFSVTKAEQLVGFYYENPEFFGNGAEASKESSNTSNVEVHDIPAVITKLVRSQRQICYSRTFIY